MLLFIIYVFHLLFGHWFSRLKGFVNLMHFKACCAVWVLHMVKNNCFLLRQLVHIILTVNFSNFWRLTSNCQLLLYNKGFGHCWRPVGGIAYLNSTSKSVLWRYVWLSIIPDHYFFYTKLKLKIHIQNICLKILIWFSYL